MGNINGFGALATAMALALLPVGMAEAQTRTWAVSSPDGELSINLRQTGEGGLEYRVSLGADPVVGWSGLGLQTRTTVSVNEPHDTLADFVSTVSVAGAETSRVRDSYVMVTGKRRQNEASANQISLNVVDDESKRTLRIDVRAYDEGFAFRYALTNADIVQTTVLSEATRFALDPAGRYWAQAYDDASVWSPGYERLYEIDGSIADSAKAQIGNGYGFPFLAKTPQGVWVLLHESNLGAHNAGAHLSPGENGVFEIAPPLAAEALGFGATTATAPTPWALPWRFGIVSRELGDVVASNLVFDLAEPSRIADTSWIKPGVSSWSWWADHASSKDMAKLKDYIDVAAEMGWPYALVDANWNTISDRSMEELVSYGNDKKVGLIFWYNSGGRHNAVPEQPRDIMSDPDRRRAEFARLAKLGVRGVKVDFFQSDKQDVMDVYRGILKDAADNGILVNFHGSTIPRGWERTWPNLVTMEAVRGAEFYTFGSEPNYGQAAPAQNATLPFTRNVIGAMDYTPVSFTQRVVERRTTNAHEAALAVVFESGILHVASSAADLRRLPTAYKDYLRAVPTVWDETRLVAGYPGKDVVIARRHGQDWYVAGINGEARAKTLKLDLSFIDAARVEGALLHDGRNPTRRFASKTFATRTPGAVSMPVAANGGFVLIVRGRS